jgi:hypothetical protein
MTNLQKSAPALAVACFLAAVVVRALRPEVPPVEPEPPYSFSNGRLIVAAGSKMLSHLEIVPVGQAAEESLEFRSVGQIIALSNISGNLTGNRLNWVELDPQLSASAGLGLGSGDPPGTAYGLTRLASEYSTRIKIGQGVEIVRYGLQKPEIPAVITKIIPQPEAAGVIDVVFRFTHAEQWFPGTNCSVAFPVLRGRPVVVPMTAPVHEGILEYVWKEEVPGQFTAHNVSVVDATPENASVMGLQAGDRIVARGAIMLKPLLKAMLMHQAQQKRG